MSTLYRAYSSPNLKLRGKNSSSREFQEDKYGYETEDEEFYMIGDRVLVDGSKTATVAYFGEVDFADGDWVGVSFDEPLGYHDGKRYFQCAPFHGQFVRPHRLTRIRDSALGSSATSSRISTPLPSFNPQRPTSSSSVGSYYYDGDYRQEKKPTISSLVQKLKSINDSRNTSSPIRLSNFDKSNGGILKRNPRSESTDPMSTSARTEELSNRIRAQSASRSPVFNFRPKREQLRDYEGEATFLSEHYGSPKSKRFYGRTLVDLSTEPPNVGDKVVAKTGRGELTGTLRFLGETEFASGEWAGLELDHPEGKNDGAVLGYRYFHCPKQYGLFLPAARVKKYQPAPTESRKPEFNSIRNTIKSPPPLIRATLDPYNSRSTTPNYDRSPSVELSSYSHGDKTTIHDSRLSSPASYYTKSNYDTSSPTKGYREPNLLPLSYIDETYPRSRPYGYNQRPKFDETDLDIELKKSLSKPSTPRKITNTLNSNHESAKAKAVKYTFSSSKYDGNPIARRTLIYE